LLLVGLLVKEMEHGLVELLEEVLAMGWEEELAHVLVVQ